MKLKENKELKELIRELNEEEYQGLKNSIEKEGLDKPIDVMADGTILDGHQRYKAVQELGREIPEDKIVTHPEIDTLQKAKEFVVRSEIRRHPRPYERCLLAYKVYYKSVVNSQPKGSRVDEILSKKAQVGVQLFSRAKKIIEEGSEEQKRMLLRGKLSINKAYNEIMSERRKKAKYDLGYVFRNWSGSASYLSLHGRYVAYETKNGVYCLGCGLRVESVKEFTNHIMRVVPTSKKNIKEHFKEWFKEDISRDPEYGEDWLP